MCVRVFFPTLKTEVGVNFGITAQIFTMALLAFVVSEPWGFDPTWTRIFPREIPLDRMLSGNLGAGSLVFNLAGLPSEHGHMKC